MTPLDYPRDVIQNTIHCDEDTAEQVRLTLAGLFTHRQTQAFLSAFCNLSRTTYADGKDAAPSDMLVQEGKRRVALFIMACAADRAGNSMEVRNYIEEGSDGSAQ